MSYNVDYNLYHYYILSILPLLHIIIENVYRLLTVNYISSHQVNIVKVCIRIRIRISKLVLKVASDSQLCHFALFKIKKKKIRPVLTQHATQLLIQPMVISQIHYCNALIMGMPICLVELFAAWQTWTALFDPLFFHLSILWHRSQLHGGLIVSLFVHCLL